jgi:hypothetical protein
MITTPKASMPTGGSHHDCRASRRQEGEKRSTIASAMPGTMPCRSALPTKLIRAGPATCRRPHPSLQRSLSSAAASRREPGLSVRCSRFRLTPAQPAPCLASPRPLVSARLPRFGARSSWRSACTGRMAPSPVASSRAESHDRRGIGTRTRAPIPRGSVGQESYSTETARRWWSSHRPAPAGLPRPVDLSELTEASRRGRGGRRARPAGPHPGG